MARALAFVMLVGAARHDADPRTLKDLRDALPDIKHAINTKGYLDAEAIVYRIMGDGWQPAGEFGEFRKRMLSD